YHTSQRHQLAAALQKYVEEKGAFPRGTADRDSGRGTLPYLPNQRVAWTAEIVPYLGGNVAGLTIDSKKSWNEGNNKTAASTAIPHFLAPNEPPGAYPRESWSFEHPGFSVPVMATHYVGIAGV